MDSSTLIWIQTFDASIQNLAQLADGHVFSAILSEIDASWFKVSAALTTESNASWVFKFNFLKKLLKLMLSYLDNQLNIKPSLTVNLNAIAKDGSIADIVAFATLVLCIVVQCSNNAAYIARIQKLDSKIQQQLMLAIDSTISKNALLSPVESNIDQLRKELDVLQKSNASLAFTNAQLMGDGGAVSSHVDSLLKQELKNIKDTLQMTQDQLAESQSSHETQANKLQVLTRNAQDHAQSTKYAARLKDQLDEFQHLADKLQKTEALNEKYKRKLDESVDLSKRIKKLEVEKNDLRDSYSTLETENSELKALDSQKEFSKTLEEEKASLLIKASKSEFEVRELNLRLVRFEAEKRVTVDLNANLEDRLREYELAEDDRFADQPLNKEMDSNLSDSQLRQKVKQLERQLEGNKADSNSDERIVLMANLLEDSNHLKDKFENDYLMIYQQKLALESELKQKSLDAGSNALNLTIVERGQEIASLQARLVAIQRDSNAISVAEISNDLQAARVKNESAIQHQRILDAKINQLHVEKEKLIESSIDLKDRLSVEKRSSGELRALLAGFESSETGDGSLKIATQKLVQLIQQNDALHQALKQAKERIVNSDKLIKNTAVRPASYEEAMTSYEVIIREKDIEMKRMSHELTTNRNAVAKEQRLMASAYHNLGMQIQRFINNNGSNGSYLGSQRRGLEMTNQRK